LSAALLVGIVVALSQQNDEIMRRLKISLSVLIRSSELIFDKFHDSSIAQISSAVGVLSWFRTLPASHVTFANCHSSIDSSLNCMNLTSVHIKLNYLVSQSLKVTSRKVSIT
jgi:hypothetical protein